MRSCCASTKCCSDSLRHRFESDACWLWESSLELSNTAFKGEMCISRFNEERYFQRKGDVDQLRFFYVFTNACHSVSRSPTSYQIQIPVHVTSFSWEASVSHRSWFGTKTKNKCEHVLTGPNRCWQTCANKHFYLCNLTRVRVMIIINK